MDNRLSLFLGHAVARGGKAHMSALALVQGPAQIQAIDVKEEPSKAFKGEKVKSYNFFEKRIKKIKPIEDSNSFDSILIIGAGVPNSQRTAYKSINGINKVQSLIEPIEDILSSYLKDNGHIRVQICHSNTCKDLDKTTTFAQRITAKAINKKNATLSAPESFSIISTNDARVFDVTTQNNAFMKMRGPCKNILNNKKDDLEIQNEFMRYLNQAGKDDKVIFKNVLQSVKLVNHDIDTPFNQEDIRNALAEEEFLTTRTIMDMEEEKMEMEKPSGLSLSYSTGIIRSMKAGSTYDASFFTTKETDLVLEQKTSGLNEKVTPKDTTDKVTIEEDVSDLENIFNI